MVLMNHPGPALLIRKEDSLLHPGVEYIMPYKESFVHASTQDLSQPVQKLWEWLKDAITTAADFASGTPAAIVDGAMNLQDLLGAKLNNKYYYASAWAGAKPSTLSLNLEFTRGMAQLWDSKKEVYDPILDIYSETVPHQAEKSGILTSPSPAPLTVLSAYTAEIINTTLTVAAQAADAVATLGTSIFDQSKAKYTDWISAKLNASDVNQYLQGSKTWTVQFGWFNGTKFLSVYDLTKLVVDNSKMEFKPSFEKIGETLYPVAGTVSLSFKSQTITTSYDVKTSRGSR